MATLLEITASTQEQKFYAAAATSNFLILCVTHVIQALKLLTLECGEVLVLTWSTTREI